MRALVKSVFPLLLVSSVLAIVTAHFQGDSEVLPPQWKLRRDAPLEVRLAPVGRGRIVHAVEAPGKVEAEAEVKVSAEVAGKIARLPVQENAPVSKGQLLVQIDPVYYEAEVHSNEAKVRRARASVQMCEADLIKARRDADRIGRLYRNRAEAQQNADDAASAYQKEKAHLDVLKEELRDAEALLTKSKEDLRKATIRAPFDGVVTELPAKEGEVALVGTMNNPGTVILTVSDPKSMIVRARVDEANVALVRPGQPVAVYLQNDTRRPLTGTVKRVSPKGVKASASGTPSSSSSDSDVTYFETVVALDAPTPEVRLGMTAHIEIRVEGRDGVLAVPPQAVLHRRARDLPRRLLAELAPEAAGGGRDPGRYYQPVVFVCAGGAAECRPVQTGVSDRTRVEILSGLKEGERLIVGPYQVFDRLRDGKPVAEMAEREGGDE
jgi:HlyD family secretion protein